MIKTYTVTELQPGPVTGPFPATVTQTAITQAVWEDRVTYLSAGPSGSGSGSGSGSPSASTSVTAYVYTDRQAWVVSPPRPGMDLPPAPAGTAESLACGGATSCPASEADPHPECEARGLRTACNGGQCELRAGGAEWWCYQMWQREGSDASRRMGRACWGADGTFRQLNVPCAQGDVEVGCVPCQGESAGGWAAVRWEGPG